MGLLPDSKQKKKKNPFNMNRDLKMQKNTLKAFKEIIGRKLLWPEG